jgi:hypothetical protein
MRFEKEHEFIIHVFLGELVQGSSQGICSLVDGDANDMTGLRERPTVVAKLAKQKLGLNFSKIAKLFQYFCDNKFLVFINSSSVKSMAAAIVLEGKRRKKVRAC